MNIDVNGSPGALGDFHSLGPELIFLPVVAVLKALTNYTMIDLFLDRHSPASYVTMNTKFNCCSLSDVFVARCGNPRLNAVTLLSGVVHRVVTLLYTPLLIECFKHLTPVSTNNTAAVSAALPVVAHYYKGRFIVISVFRNFVMSFDIPFLMALFYSI